ARNALPIGIPERKRHPSARRRNRAKARFFENPRTSHVPRIRQQQNLGAMMHRPKGVRLCFVLFNCNQFWHLFRSVRLATSQSSSSSPETSRRSLRLAPRFLARFPAHHLVPSLAVYKTCHRRTPAPLPP